MAINRQPPKLRDLAFAVLVKQGLFSTEHTYTLTPSPGISPEGFDEGVSIRIVQMATEQLLPKLLQAVIDDDRKTVKEMLDVTPQLLLLMPNKNCVIESQYTWQKFYAEPALTMATKRKQVEMVELLLPYFDQLRAAGEEDVTKIVQAQFAVREDDLENSKYEETLPAEYQQYIRSLVNVCSDETFPDGRLSQATEDELSFFLKMLLPLKAVKLDDYVDVEKLLYVAYKAYDDHFDVFQNWEQRDAFCIRVIGGIQSLLSPETGKVFCVGLYDVVERNQKISERGASLTLLDGRPFYRGSRESRSGLGFEFLCAGSGRGRVSLPWRWRAPGPWKSYVEQKRQACKTYAATFTPKSFCVV